tara:strand:- start:105 stop:515 length:411 start_codon:yes stop_codon:yes gene_type:complete
MTLKKHKQYYYTFLILCIIGIFSLDKSIANYIPIVWAFLGFALHVFLFSRVYRKLCGVLVSRHSLRLRELHISYGSTLSVNSVDIFSLMGKRREVAKISKDLETGMKYLSTYFIFVLVGFMMFGVLGFLTVAKTWY